MEEIVENADAQMIARGDMATETDFTGTTSNAKEKIYQIK